MHFSGPNGENATVYSYSDPNCQRDKKAIQHINNGECTPDCHGLQLASLYFWEDH